MKISAIQFQIDAIIRILFYLLIFFVPFGKAVVESAVVISSVLWILKRSLGLWEMRRQKLASVRSIFNIEFLKDLGTAFRPVGSPLNQGIIIFLLIGIVSIFGSQLPAQSLHGFLTKTIEWFAIYFLVIEVFTQRHHLKLALNIFMISAFANGLDTLIQYYLTHKDLIDHRELVDGYRATGAFSHPNMLGAYLTMAIPVSVTLFVSKTQNRFLQIFFAICSIVLIWTLFLTFSRGAWTGTALGLIFLGLFSLVNRGIPWGRKGLIIILVILGVWAAMQAFHIKNQINITKKDTETIEWRIALWKESIFLIRKRPFFGHGLNTFMPVMENHLISTQSPLAQGYSASYAHNCYLQIAVETGILGLGAFCGIIAILFKTILTALPKTHNQDFWLLGILSGLLAFLIHAFVDINFYSLEHPAIFWCVTGILIVLQKLLSPQRSCVIN